MGLYQVRYHLSHFNSSNIARDNNFYFVTITKNNPNHFRDYVNDTKHLCLSIKSKLSDWNGKPNFQTVLTRLKYSGLFLFYHKQFTDCIGWAWFNDTYAYDYINTIQKLPTDNSAYYGGVYIRKDLDIPPSTGLQMYLQLTSYILDNYEYGYCVTDEWNRASKFLAHQIGAKEFNFIKQ